MSTATDIFNVGAVHLEVAVMTYVRRRVALVCLLVFVAAASAARAQTVSATTGAINGTVTDTTRAVLPGVTITLSGPAVMGAPTAVTDQNGFFRLPSLTPGDYQLTFELS